MKLQHICIVLLLALAACTVDTPIDMPEVQDKCGEGYVETPNPDVAPRPGLDIGTYCKLDVGWDDLEKCTQQSDCGEGYTCESRMADEQTRCTPDGHWKMACSCTPDGSCVCA